MAASALIVKTPEADAVVGSLRNRYDATSKLGVPAHITILFPFMPPESVTPEVLNRLRSIFATVPAFSYTLDSIGRFEKTTYLAPVPAEPFIALTTRVVKQFPEFPPYSGQYAGVIPHLTVAHGDERSATIAETELTTGMRSRPPIVGQCNAVSLLENSSGLWREACAFELLR
ncbi:2'-5' RNA ligase [Bordetella sputigena]|uniref:2'-5' RNA ligase family protein n=1 Tax=Bordetella sputigena TaxID=1416810 RepID=UPI0039F092E3